MTAFDMMKAEIAFDVMMRRGWGVEKSPFANEWKVKTANGYYVCKNGAPLMAADPFTALVEADRWYKENIEKE